jgi:hypothetical protein
MARRKPKKRPRASGPSMVVGIGWYERAEWAKLKTVVADTGNIDDTYEEWLSSAERAERQLARPGLAMRRVPINVDALVAWCAARQKAVDGAARAEYVQELVSAMA